MTKMPRRIHIIGSTGSGKTYLAKNLSKQWDIPYYELDKVMWSIEKSNYRQTLKGLLEMIKWNHGFEAKQKKEILEILKPYNHKLVIVKNNNDIINKSGSLLSEL